MVTNADLLEPVDVRDHLLGLELTLGQVCQVAGISKMQLDYWTQKAEIPTHGRKQRTYDMALRRDGAADQAGQGPRALAECGDHRRAGVPGAPRRRRPAPVQTATA